MTAALCLMLMFASDEIPTASGNVTITPIKHASFMLEAAGKVIHVDPWGPSNFESKPAADLILITDIHQDHLDVSAIAKVLKTGTVVIAPPAAIEKLKDAKPLKNGETTKWEGWSIEAIPAYNLQRGPAPGRLFHEKGRGNGYVLTFGGNAFTSPVIRKAHRR